MEKDVDARNNRLLENSQATVLDACWSTFEDIETFYLFPEILSVDATFSTNKEKRPLCSLLKLGRTTIGVTFQHFDVTYLLSKNLNLNLLLDA
jgi:hypothetical protein